MTAGDIIIKNISMKIIGVIRTPFTENKGIPIQSSRSDAAGEAEIFHQYLEGLNGVEEFSNIYLLYVFI